MRWQLNVLLKKISGFSVFKVAPDGKDNVYAEFTKLASNPNGYWSSNTMIGFDYNFNRVTKAFVLSYHNTAISSWAVNNYSMNVMCVNQL